MQAAPFVHGFATSGTLIVAIGAQNALLLTQAIRGEHHLPIALVCTLCDALLIATGVLGVGAAVASTPWLSEAVAMGGACFLLWYGLGSFRAMAQARSLRTQAVGPGSLGNALALTLVVTLLNPHAYLDTIVLLGGVSSQYQGQARLVFGVGAASASLVWFFSLALFGRLLAPLFRRPVTWQLLDGAVGLTMWCLAAALMIHVWAPDVG